MHATPSSKLSLGLCGNEGAAVCIEELDSCLMKHALRERLANEMSNIGVLFPYWDCKQIHRFPEHQQKSRPRYPHTYLYRPDLTGGHRNGRLTPTTVHTLCLLLNTVILLCTITHPIPIFTFMSWLSFKLSHLKHILLRCGLPCKMSPTPIPDSRKAQRNACFPGSSRYNEGRHVR